MDCGGGQERNFKGRARSIYPLSASLLPAHVDVTTFHPPEVTAAIIGAFFSFIRSSSNI